MEAIRKIQFRAWDKGHNKMFYKVNLYSMNRTGEMDKAQIDDQQAMKTIGFACEVMQFTGLQDKNKKDIYEGDIVNFSFDGVLFIDNGTYVVFKKGAFLIQKKNFCPLVSDTKWIEVIGNIFEHPVLISSPIKDGKQVKNRRYEKQ